MCRNIRPLQNFDPPATSAEVAAAALQYVRKITGATAPPERNRERFEQAVRDIAALSAQLLDEWETTAPPRDRAVEAVKARARNEKRFGAAAVTAG